MDDEFEVVASEARRLQILFASELDERIGKWAALVERHKHQVERWRSTRPHSRKLEVQFLEQDAAILRINSEFREWIQKYNSEQSQLRNELLAPDCATSTKLALFKRTQHAFSHYLEVEIPLLSKILERFEESISNLGEFGASPSND